MHRQIPLSYLCPGTKAIVADVKTDDFTRRRLQDMGFTKGTVVEYALVSPLGEPVAYYIKGTLIALRIEDASKIFVE